MRLLAALALTAIVLAPPAARAERIILKAGRVVDPESGTVTTNRTIVVEDGRIKEIGAADAGGGARVIDLSDATVLIKLVVDDQPYIYSAEDIRAAVDEAARAGLKVAAHCVTEPGARNAIEGGVASVEHGTAMPDTLLALARERKVVLVGTDFTPAATPSRTRPRCRRSSS